jgi:Putative addiction module component
MSKPFDEIANEASQLPRELRLSLATMLLEVDDGESSAETDAAWEREILARLEAVDQGSARSSTLEEVLSEANDLLTQ